MWITNAGITDVATVWAQTEDGICGFLVPRRTPGFNTQDIRQKMSLRTPGVGGISLEYSPLRHANNLESVLACEGTSEMHTRVVGQALTGQAAFR